MEALFRLHADMPQQGPGSDAATLDVLRRLPPLPDRPRVLDLGCGPGRQTLALARALGTRIIAVDLHRPFLDQLEKSAAEQGLAHLVETRQADMAAPGEAEGSVDLIWSEGAAYILEFRKALATWRRLLKPGGLLVASEITWLTDHPPEEPAAFWRAAYPTMGTVASNCAAARDEGFEILDTVPLPSAAWWDGYYNPLHNRIDMLRGEAAANPALMQVLIETEAEIALFERWNTTYGYVFYILRRPPA